MASEKKDFTKKELKMLKAKLIAMAKVRKFKQKFREEEDFPGFTRGEIAKIKLREKKEKQKKELLEKRKNKKPSKRLRPGGGGGIPNSLIKGGLNNYKNRIK
tara:strand:- start:376 stop:681 length:306 start_codon:yes stop_codon:yes gene_type:complete